MRAVLETRPAPPSEAAPPERQEALRGQLDAIVLKALEKEPGRRYQTVGELAAAVARLVPHMRSG